MRNNVRIISSLLIILIALTGCGKKSEKKNNTTKDVSKKYQKVGEYINGYAIVYNDYRYGIVDESGKEIVAPKYEEIRPFVNGMAAVRNQY